MANWDKRFLDLAEHISTWSKDHSTKFGAVIVGPSNEIRSIGYNGFPRGCNDDLPERHERPEKYLWTEHAERNAIYNAARVGIPLEGSRLYVRSFPCIDCARSIVQSGITKVTFYKPDKNSDFFQRWKEHYHRTLTMFNECGVDVSQISIT